MVLETQARVESVVYHFSSGISNGGVVAVLKVRENSVFGALVRHIHSGME